MNEPLPIPAPSPRLDAALLDAHRAAVAIGRPVLLRVGLPGLGVDPLAAFAGAHRQARPATFWREPGGSRFAAVGRVAVAATADLAEAGARWRDWADRVVSWGGVDGPLAVFAASFDALGERRGDAWRDWPRTELDIPACVVRVDAQTGSDAVLQIPVAPGADLAALEARLDETVRDILTTEGVRTSTGVPAAESRDDEPQESWCRRVAEITDACRRGAVNKVVPARAARFDAPAGLRFDPAATLAHLDRHHPTARVFGFTRGGRAFVGATPELLARLNGRRVETHALAGTAPRSTDPARDAELGRALLASDKDRREQAVVVDAIAEALGPLSETVMVDGAPRLRRLPTLQHLETAISARMLPDIGLLDVAHRLHPTPALGGQPRAAALAWLRRTEPLDRGWYGAPIGWLDADGGGIAAVAIRSARIDAHRAWTFAGAGVVAGSDPETEWTESALKLETMGRALRLVGRPRSPLDESESSFDPDQGGPTTPWPSHSEEVQHRAGSKGPRNRPADLVDDPPVRDREDNR